MKKILVSICIVSFMFLTSCASNVCSSSCQKSSSCAKSKICESSCKKACSSDKKEGCDKKDSKSSSEKK